jgi:HAD superfamily hydrolase (TIGR01484 family)
MLYKGLIFLDIDGTLLMPNYKTNSGKLPLYIKKLSKQGYLFCLNSNRAEQDLKPIIKQFFINGPVIGEHGTFFIFKNKRFSLFTSSLISKKLVGILKKVRIINNAFCVSADTVDYSWNKLNETPLAWVVNKYRKYTASIHVRAWGKRDFTQAKKLAQLLKPYFKKTHEVQVSPIFCNVLLNPKGVNKGKALAMIRKNFFPKVPAVMIGDDAADLPTLKIINAFYAVGNAEPGLKRKATFVASKPFTQGVLEILQHIDKYGIPK